MEHVALRDVDISIDLESGEGTTSEEDSSIDFVSSSRQPKVLLSRVCSPFFEQSENGEYGVGANCSSLGENVKAFPNRNLGEQVGFATVKKKCKKKSAKKNPKPPRPPRGPSLDAADQMLIREINELALLKKARIERAKASKIMRSSKSSSSISSLFALLFTVFFILVIFFHGMSRKNLPVSFQGSPESAAGGEGNFISVQYHKSSSPKDTAILDWGSPILVERNSGLERNEVRGEKL